MEWTRRSGWFPEKADCAGNKPATLELKILAVLRVLDRGYCFEGVEELCLISAEVLRIFFLEILLFIRGGKFSDILQSPSHS